MTDPGYESEPLRVTADDIEAALVMKPSLAETVMFFGQRALEQRGVPQSAIRRIWLEYADGSPVETLEGLDPGEPIFIRVDVEEEEIPEHLRDLGDLAAEIRISRRKDES